MSERKPETVKEATAAEKASSGARENDTWHRQRKAHNREELIEAARVLFMEQDFPRVAIKDVCERAGISRVTFYKHFQSIDELAFEVQMRALERMEEWISAADVPNENEETRREGRLTQNGTVPEPVLRSGAARLRRMLEAWSLYAASHQGDMRFVLLFDLHYDAYPPEPALTERYDAHIRSKKEQHFLIGALQAGTRDGSLQPDLNLRETGEFVFTAMMGLLQMLSLPGGKRSETADATERISRRFIDMILYSLEPK